jgi:hypothetical protein
MLAISLGFLMGTCLRIEESWDTILQFVLLSNFYQEIGVWEAGRIASELQELAKGKQG